MSNFEHYLNKCQEGNFSAVEIFLTEGGSPDSQNAEGETGLQVAAANGYLDITTLLLNNGASVDLANNYGWTPLMHAARHGHSEIISFLIQRKAKVNLSNRLGVRPIDLAAWSGNLSSLKLIVEAGAIIDRFSLISSEKDSCDISPLMAASLRGYNSVARTLLEKGSVANQASPVTGLTPLMLAACNGHRSTVEVLIEFGSDANSIDICCRTALDLAAVCCKDEVVTYLENLTQPTMKKLSGAVPHDNNILRLVRVGDIGQVKSLLQQNQNFSNYTELDDGVSPLMIAAMLGLTHIADLLMSNGADLNAQDKTNGWTPLMYAVFHRQSEIVHLLLEKGADIDICTSNGYTALDLAIHADSSETDILSTLLAYSGPEELLDNGESTVTSTSSTMKQSYLTVQKAPSRTDSQARFKDLFGSFSNHLRQLSRSSAVSPTIDLEVFDETLYDVFPEEDTKETPSKGKFLCLSKFYAPHERFGHLVKQQEVEAINLPPLPSHVSSGDLVKTLCPGIDISSKPHFNSLRTPHILKRIMKKINPAISVAKTDNYIPSERLSIEKVGAISAASITGSKPNSTLQQKVSLQKQTSEDVETASESSTLKLSSAFSEEALTNISNTGDTNSKDISTISVAGTSAGLTALLSKGSLKKYADNFKAQEIDLETFKYLTEEDLHEIGINSFNSRHKLMKIISDLKNS